MWVPDCISDSVGAGWRSGGWFNDDDYDEYDDFDDFDDYDYYDDDDDDDFDDFVDDHDQFYYACCDDDYLTTVVNFKKNCIFIGPR